MLFSCVPAQSLAFGEESLGKSALVFLDVGHYGNWIQVLSSLHLFTVHE